MFSKLTKGFEKNITVLHANCIIIDIKQIPRDNKHTNKQTNDDIQISRHFLNFLEPET